MSYFKHMPATIYRGDYSGQIITALDITVRAKILEYIKDSGGTVVDYIIRDGERPEHLAHRVYGHPEYHWVNLLYNEIHDPFFEWPISNHDVENLVDSRYTGRAYFIDLNKATAEQADFYFEPGTATLKGGLTATITEWDPNLYKIVVDSDSPGEASVSLNSSITQTRSDGRTVSAVIKRVVSDNRYAVHHFVNQDTDEVVDHHIVKTDPTVRYDLGAQDSVENSSIIQRYVSGSAEIVALDDMTVTIKTNYQYEIEKNDSRRKIKVMRPEFVDVVVNDLKKAFAGA